MKTRDNQRGGIVIFAIIGVLLAGLLAGGLYLSKQQARIADEGATPTVAIDTEKEANESEEETAPVKEESEEAAPAPATTPAPKPEAAVTQPSTPAVTSATRTTVAASGPSEPLPSTGPSDIALSVFAITAITFVGFVFVQSTSRLRRSALGR